MRHGGELLFFRHLNLIPQFHISETSKAFEKWGNGSQLQKCYSKKSGPMGNGEWYGCSAVLFFHAYEGFVRFEHGGGFP